MDIYQIKKYIDEYYFNDIYFLAKYYNLTEFEYLNDNDLSWLIALNMVNKKAFMDPGKAWDNYKAELIVRLSNDDTFNGSLNDLPPEFIQADPTKNLKYLQWIITSYINGGVGQFSNLFNVKSALNEYLALTKKKNLLQPFERDIYTFCGLTGCNIKNKEKIGLYALFERYPKEIDEIRKKSKVKQQEKNIDIIMDNDSFLLLIPKTKDAAIRYGKNTKWCTAAEKDNMFDEYNKTGRLYILIPKFPSHIGEKYQLHFEDDIYMDEIDNPIIIRDLLKKFPKLKELINGFALQEINLLQQKANTSTLQFEDVIDYLIESKFILPEMLESFFSNYKNHIDPYTQNMILRNIIKSSNYSSGDDINKQLQIFFRYFPNEFPDRKLLIAIAIDKLIGILHINTFNLLINKIDPAYSDNRLLIKAIKEDREDIVKLLLNNKNVIDIFKRDTLLLGNTNIYKTTNPVIISLLENI